MGLQEADVENRMDLHGRRKIEMECGRTNLANDGEGTKSADIQFGRRTGGGDVTAEEPYFLSWKEIWGLPTAPIG